MSPSQYRVALWKCGQCQVCWGSQTDDRVKAHYMLKMAELNTDLFLWEDYRGWRVKAEEANLCPECGQLTQLPVLTLLPQPFDPVKQS